MLKKTTENGQIHEQKLFVVSEREWGDGKLKIFSNVIVPFNIAIHRVAQS